MENSYKIVISNSENILFQCTYVASRYTTNQVPRDMLDMLGERYAPCNVRCTCTNEGWTAEKNFS